MRCPCRKKSEDVAYADCCERLHLGTRTAATPEELMRSRYAAFALRKEMYLRATWHPSTCPVQVRCNPGQEWLHLQVIRSLVDGDRGTVEFIARSRIGGRSHAMHETSRFVREDGRWYYVDGMVE